jgi:hypothetical protein
MGMSLYIVQWIDRKIMVEEFLLVRADSKTDAAELIVETGIVDSDERLFAVHELCWGRYGHADISLVVNRPI